MKEEKGGVKRGEKGSQGGFVDGSHDWGREGSGDCGIRVVIEESGVSKSNHRGASRRLVAV